MTIIKESASESYYFRPPSDALAAVPAALRDSPQWLCWKEVPKKNQKKPAKVPVNPATLQYIDPHAPENWMSFEAALLAFANTPELAGIGFDFAPENPFAGIDIDNCRNIETGEIEPWAMELARLTYSYCEVSPSGKSIKLFVRADLAGRACHFEYAGREIEAYSAGRYFTVTGVRVDGLPLEVRDRQKLLAKLLPAEPEAVLREPPPRLVDDPANKYVDGISDAALLNTIEKSKQGAKFRALMNGDVSGYAGYFGASGALAVILAYWTRCNPERIDKIMRSSGLIAGWEDWWEESRRGEKTINKACALAAAGWLYDPTEWPEVAAMLEEFNDRFYVIEDYGGKCRVCWEDKNPSFKLDKPLLNHQSFDDFRNRFMHQLIKVGEETEGYGKNEKVVPVYESRGKAWLKHNSRRQYREVLFAPGIALAPDLRNLWQGFAFAPRKGDCSKYLAHVLNNICRKDKDDYEWLLGWMAYAVRNPAEMGHVAVVLRGKKGVGKNVFAEAFNALWGRHGIVLASEQHIASHFNAHLLGKCSLVADEAFFAGDPKQMRLLKGIITGEQIAIESKGVNTILVPNFLKVIIIGNDEWLVSASGDERRFFALECGDANRADHPYFAAIAAELQRGGYAALLYMLLYEIDLSKFDVRAAPHTAILRDQMLESVDGASRLWLECLTTGELPGPDPNEAIEPATLADDGSVWLHLGSFLKRALKEHPKLMGRVSVKHLAVLFAEADFKKAPRKDPRNPRRWDIPPLRECRDLWDAKRFPVPWEESADEWVIPPPPQRRSAYKPEE